MFHSPSEHTIDGVSYDTELQVVHQAYDSNDTAIISVLFTSVMNINSCLLEKLNIPNVASLQQSDTSS